MNYWGLFQTTGKVGKKHEAAKGNRIGINHWDSDLTWLPRIGHKADHMELESKGEHGESDRTRTGRIALVRGDRSVGQELPAGVRVHLPKHKRPRHLMSCSCTVCVVGESVLFGCGGGGRVARGHRFESLIALVVIRVCPGRYHSTTVVQNK